MGEGLVLIFKSLVMGIVEGITEFLPISSTGHLIVAGEVMGIPEEFGKNFEVIIQLGAILAVVYYFRSKIFDSLRNLKRGQWGSRLWINVMVGFMPAAVIGFLLKDEIEKMFSPLIVAWAMIIGAVLIYISQLVFKNNKLNNLEDASIKKSLIIGLAQCISMIPGMSRSAFTIMGGMVAGFNVKTAAEYSFFLAIPTMLAASGYKFVTGFSGFTASESVGLLGGFIMSFIVALVVVDKFLEFLGKRSLNVFAYYRLIAGIGLLILIKAGFIPM